MKQIVVIGAGGHARVLIEAIAFDQSTRLVGALDNDRRLWGSSILNVPIAGGDDHLPKLIADRQCDSFVAAVGSVHQTSLRRNLFQMAVDFGLSPYTVRHAQSVCSASAVLGAGCQLLARSFINTGAVLDENVIVNSGAIVEHDCEIGAHCHIAPTACLAGGVRVGVETHIGLGALVRENLCIGDRVIVGAGALVINDIPDDTVVVGSPARPLQRSHG